MKSIKLSKKVLLPAPPLPLPLPCKLMLSSQGRREMRQVWGSTLGRYLVGDVMKIVFVYADPHFVVPVNSKNPDHDSTAVRAKSQIEVERWNSRFRLGSTAEQILQERFERKVRKKTALATRP